MRTTLEDRRLFLKNRINKKEYVFILSVLAGGMTTLKGQWLFLNFEASSKTK